MKLSEVKGERVFDVIAELVKPVASIMKDESVTEIFQKKELPEGMTPVQFFASRAESAIPALLVGHRADMVAIMCSIKGITEEECFEDMTLASFVKDFVELFEDEEFQNFLS